MKRGRPKKSELLPTQQLCEKVARLYCEAIEARLSVVWILRDLEETWALSWVGLAIAIDLRQAFATLSRPRVFPITDRNKKLIRARLG